MKEHFDGIATLNFTSANPKCNIFCSSSRNRRIEKMSGEFRIGDPVWAKMKGFSPWPGKVSIDLAHQSIYSLISNY